MEAMNKLRAMCEAATPGPWEHKQQNEYYGQGYGETTEFVDMPNIGLLKVGLTDKQGQPFHVNAAFIAASRSAMPALIELVEAMERERECSQAVSACAKEAILRPSEENKEAHKAAYCVYKATVAAVESAKAKLEAACPK